MDQCLNCLRLHLGRANSLIEEWINGYEGHDWLAMAEMGLAEWHCGVALDELRRNIRNERKSFEKNRAVLPDLLSLIVQCNLMEKEDEKSDQVGENAEAGVQGG